MSSFSYKIDEVYGLRIVRDDLLAGGTKQRGLAPLVTSLEIKEVVYPGTVLGYGALALAEACNNTDAKAVIFVSPDTKHRTTILEKLNETDADIRLSNEPRPVSFLESRAKAYTEKRTDIRQYMPPGFATPTFRKHMKQALTAFPETIDELWVGAVSGTMAHILEDAFPHAEMYVVAFAKHHGYKGRGTIYQAPEKYHRPAKQPPPYPSFKYCDAKIWQFAQEHAGPGAFVWNMGA